MSKPNVKIWQALLTMLITLYFFPIKAIADDPQEVPQEQPVTESQVTSQEPAMPEPQMVSQEQIITKPQAASQEPAMAVPSSDSNATSKDELSLSAQALAKEQEISQELDPTRPADFSLDSGRTHKNARDKRGGKRLVLTAIFIGTSKKVAIINGTLLKEGESIAGKKVEEITKYKVKLMENKKILELKLPIALIKEAS